MAVEDVFPALPGFYGLLFATLEPVSTALPLAMTAVQGAPWFHHQLIPSTWPAPSTLDARSTMAIWQLTNCYLLLAMISFIVFRAVKAALKHDPVAQERIVGASLTALAIADVTHIAATLILLPEQLRWNVKEWNSMVVGNVPVVVVLLAIRLAWFAGVGRKTYYYGQKLAIKKD